MTMRAHTFSSALILTRRDACAAVDRTSLRAAGITHIRVLTSGRDAARWLITPPEMRMGAHVPSLPDVIVCDERLADMSGLDFIRLIRRHRRLVWLPVVLVMSSPTEGDVTEAAGAGCSAVLTRPYTLATLVTHLRRAEATITPGAALRQAARNGVRLLGDADFEKAIDALDAVVADADTQALEAYRHAMRSLLDKHWDRAIAGFNRALRHNALKGDAELGLSAAWRGKGDIVRSRAYLRAASETFARSAQWQRARETLCSLLREAPESGNALLDEAARLIRAGNFEAAAHALLTGRDLSPAISLHRHVARASQFTNDPQATVAGVCAAMTRAGSPEVARDLQKRVVGGFGTPESHPQPPAQGMLARFPLLHDVLAVARYTLRMWRSAA